MDIEGGAHAESRRTIEVSKEEPVSRRSRPLGALADGGDDYPDGFLIRDQLLWQPGVRDDQARISRMGSRTLGPWLGISSRPFGKQSSVKPRHLRQLAKVAAVEAEKFQ